ncbi:unnamed protein product [Phytophthora fragariaefolia]|uniref:Unnamed protein product n=1 Tax=Phytophthora fragariaefolia TaxID=1490495 RepID=A0A9W6XEJ9_9STRA|nr:unnamed protein product [Phytophthora fragariaefolia]
MNRTLVEMARAMMHYMEVDRQWWGEAVMTAAHIVNRVPNTALRDKSPFEVLTGVQPLLDYFRVFVAHGYVHLDKSKRAKWDARSHRRIFLGYADGSKAYRVWDCEDQRLVKTRTVVLDECVPARYRDGILVHDGDGQYQRQAAVDDDDEFVPSDAPTSPDAPATGMEVDETGEQPSSMEVDDAPASEPSSVVSLAGGSQPNLREMSDRMRSSESLTRTLCMGGSEGARGEGQVPTVRDSFIQLPALSSSKLIAAPEPTRSLPSSENRIVFSGGSRPADEGDGEPDPKCPRLHEYEIALAATDVPSSYKAAMASPEAKHWKEDIWQEIRSHVRNHTWDLLRRPHSSKVIGCKWVFAHKFDEKGNIVRYKARLVALGCLQTRGVDYFYTYSPVASSNTVRVFLAVCCSMRLEIRQFDIETAFLNGTLDDTWQSLKASVLMEISFASYVEAFVASNKPPRYGSRPFEQLSSIWDLCNVVPTHVCSFAPSLGDARFVLGMEIDYSVGKGELTVKQTQFINRMLERFSHVDASPVRNPAVLGQDLASDDSHAMHDDERSYRELIGSLLYVANATRPYISAIVSILSQTLDCPWDMHWRVALRVLHYFKGTATREIRFRCSSSNRTGIRAYADANWGGDKRTRSTSGVLLLLGGGPVVYKSKRQATVALSSAEAEYMVLGLAAQEVLWLRYVLAEMGFSAEDPTTLQMDNKSAIGMATNQGYTPRAKHIDLRAHFVRDHIEAGRIKLEYVPTEHQLADFLTKAVPTPRLVQLCKASGIFDVQVEGE